MDTILYMIIGFIGFTYVLFSVAVVTIALKTFSIFYKREYEKIKENDNTNDV